MPETCDYPGCNRVLGNQAGKTQHMRLQHPDWDPDMPPLLAVDYDSDDENENKDEIEDAEYNGPPLHEYGEGVPVGENSDILELQEPDEMSLPALIDLYDDDESSTFEGDVGDATSDSDEEDSTSNSDTSSDASEEDYGLRLPTSSNDDSSSQDSESSEASDSFDASPPNSIPSGSDPAPVSTSQAWSRSARESLEPAGERIRALLHQCRFDLY
ncbi:hypothetical protein C8Q78DRAFT_1073030 [Trametes maxima]|nr:hypothetical protein C8Q78DRAFT_1073030 [Trametes maxima]